jgi:hypothetical protein
MCAKEDVAAAATGIADMKDLVNYRSDQQGDIVATTDGLQCRC